MRKRGEMVRLDNCAGPGINLETQTKVVGLYKHLCDEHGHVLRIDPSLSNSSGPVILFRRAKSPRGGGPSLQIYTHSHIPPVYYTWIHRKHSYVLRAEHPRNGLPNRCHQFLSPRHVLFWFPYCHPHFLGKITVRAQFIGCPL